MKLFIALIIGTLVVSSCTKVIDVNLNEANTVLVIEANYRAEDSTVNVLVTQTSNYFSNDPQPLINDAIVTITDYLGNVTSIPFIANGNYELTSYIPVFGTAYTISVVHGGITYTSSSTMNSPISQNPVFYEFTEGFFGSGSGYLVYLSYLDPVVEGDYTMAYLTINGELNSELSDIILSDDKLSNGNLIVRPLFQDLYEVDDTVHIELRTVSKDFYGYFTELQSLTDPSSAAPANPDYQWTNNALGYFSAYSSSREETVIVE